MNRVCSKCGGKNFTVIESLVHKGFFEGNKLMVYSCVDNNTDAVMCRNCETEIPLDEIEIDYCG